MNGNQKDTYSDSYIFTGLGFSLGEYKITNEEIKKYAQKNFLTGFDAERIENSEGYKTYCENNGYIDPFSWLAEVVMGFKYRYHVVPFPPTKHHYKHAENSIDLCVRAIENAIADSGISCGEIDAWFVGTATSPKPAPAIAEEVKSYFTKFTDTSPTFSLTSACVGFNINLQAAVSYLKCNPDKNHVVVAHSEVMSELLTEEKDFVPFITFGDSAAAVVLSRVKTKHKVGVTSIVNNEDMKMLDFLGANKEGNLYMDARRVKSRAVPNIAGSINQLLSNNNWKKEEVDLFVPHQTGNAIVHTAAEVSEVPLNKVFQEVQMSFGNLSGASVPASLAYLKSKSKLNENEKIVTAVAGLGGEYGGFSYVVPSETKGNKKDCALNGKTILITGATGALGSKVAHIAADKQANLILHYNSNKNKALDLKNNIEKKYQVKVKLYQSDFSKLEEVEKLCKKIKTEIKSIDYLINTQAATGNLNKASKVSADELKLISTINYKSTKIICEELSEIIESSVIFVGSVGEDAQFPGSASYVSSKRALRAFARDYAKKVYDKQIRCIYYIPGIIDSGMVNKLNKEQVNASMSIAGQKTLIPLEEISERILKSVYLHKVLKVRDEYEGVLLVRKDGYTNF